MTRRLCATGYMRSPRAEGEGAMTEVGGVEVRLVTAWVFGAHLQCLRFMGRFSQGCADFALGFGYCAPLELRRRSGARLNSVALVGLCSLLVVTVGLTSEAPARGLGEPKCVWCGGECRVASPGLRGLRSKCMGHWLVRSVGAGEGSGARVNGAAFASLCSLLVVAVGLTSEALARELCEPGCVWRGGGRRVVMRALLERDWEIR